VVDEKKAQIFEESKIDSLNTPDAPRSVDNICTSTNHVQQLKDKIKQLQA
jgi:hypothetical protein